jgi:hypothetical protein
MYLDREGIFVKGFKNIGISNGIYEMVDRPLCVGICFQD